MRIGVIGAGRIGGTLARKWVAVGHEVWIANSEGRLPLHKWPVRCRASPPPQWLTRPGKVKWYYSPCPGPNRRHCRNPTSSREKSSSTLLTTTEQRRAVRPGEFHLQ